MLNPNELSDEALAVLRVIAQAGVRQAGSAMTLSSIERSWKRSLSDLEVGVNDLEIARLVSRVDDEQPRAVVTEDGEAFFRKWFHSCY